MKCGVYDPQGSVLASTIVKANGSANGKTGAYISGSTRVSLSFYSMIKGNYVLSYRAVAWAGSPYLKCEVLDQYNNVVGSQIIQCIRSVNKNTSTDTYYSNYGAVSFTASRTGYYHFRFTPVANSWGGNGTWLEVVFGHLKISFANSANSRSSLDGGNGTTAIEHVESSDKKAEDSAWYTLQGQRVEHPTKGIYIHHGKKVVLR